MLKPAEMDALFSFGRVGPCRVIPLGFAPYRVEITRHHSPLCESAARWRFDNKVVGYFYEASVVRGGSFLRGLQRWSGGHECTAPGWGDDVYGRTPAEAVHKARRIAREWVRWQLSLDVAWRAG